MRHTYLVGVNGTAASWRALAYAAGLAGRDAGRLVIVHVNGRTDQFAMWPETVPYARAALDDAAAGLRRSVAQTLSNENLDWTLRSEAGSPFPVLVRIARLEHADALVVGASSRRLLRRSLVARLTKFARHPVIVVP